MNDTLELSRRLNIIRVKNHFSYHDIMRQLDMSWNTTKNVVLHDKYAWSHKTIKKVKAFIDKYKGDLVGAGDSGAYNSIANENEKQS